MKKLLKYFPLSLSTTNGQSLAITIIIYIVVPAVFSFVSMLFSQILILNTIMTVTSLLFIIYCLVGIVIAILKFAKMIK